MTYVSRTEFLGSYLAGAACALCGHTGVHLYEIEGDHPAVWCFPCLARKAHAGADAAERAEVERMVAHYDHLARHRLPALGCAWCIDGGRWDPA